jgi:hypothetical protein
MREKLYLYKFGWDYGRGMEVNGIFAATKHQIESALGREVYFGEVCGKHSEIFGEFNLDDLEILTEDQDFIEKAKEYGLIPFGYNPLDYLESE